MIQSLAFWVDLRVWAGAHSALAALGLWVLTLTLGPGLLRSEGQKDLE